MSNQLMTFQYEENDVQFYTKANGVVMVNATQMAKIYNKRMDDFFSTIETKNFIDSCLKSKNKERLKIENVEDLYYSKQKTGTWMHRVLGLKFAAWLNSDFELWVYYTIDQIINEEFGEMREYKESLEVLKKEEKEIERKYNTIVNKLMNNQSFIKYLDLDKQLRVITRKLKALKGQAADVISGKNLFSEIEL